MFLKVSDDYKKAVEALSDIVKEELNIKEIEFEESDDKFNSKELLLNFKLAGKVLGKDVPIYQNALKNASEEQMQKYIKEFEDTGFVTIDNLEKQPAEIFTLKFIPKKEFALVVENNNIVALDITLTDDLIDEGYYREITRQIQVARKEAGFKIEDRIVLDLTSTNAEMQKVIDKFLSKIMEETLCKESKVLISPEYETTFKVNDEDIKLKISRV